MGARIGIVGGTGYTGSELVRLLLDHPNVSLAVVTSRGEAGRGLTEVFPHLAGRVDLRFEPPQIQVLAGCDLVFFASPNGVAMEQVPELLERGVRVVDLAADFRLRDAADWAHWYGKPHACPELLAEAVYGLPELNRERTRDARLVANPGCYPTAVTLGVLPLLQEGLLADDSVIADVKSGVSGAGRTSRTDLLFAEANENFKAYNVFAHRHHPEISQTLDVITGRRVDLVFVPHLVPMTRGILATLHLRAAANDGDLQGCFERQYAAEPFVRVLPGGSHPQTREVSGTNECRIAVHRDGTRVVIISVIDNLVKGAAGQAIQNMNLMLGFEETAGLRRIPVLP